MYWQHHLRRSFFNYYKIQMRKFNEFLIHLRKMYTVQQKKKVGDRPSEVNYPIGKSAGDRD